FRYGNKLSRVGATKANQVAGEQPWSSVSVAGMVEGYRERLFKGGSGGKVAFFEIEDASGRVQAKLRGDRIELFGQLLSEGEPVLVAGKVSFPVTDEPDDEREPTLLVDSVEPLSEAVLKATRSLSIRLDASQTERGQLEKLRHVLEASPGPCAVELVLALPDGAEAVLALDSTRVTPTDQVLSGLERVFGDSVAELR
ncbi:MAG TPA: OB-fold nucleic acid binding domain-containing protein, partial [Polyangiaceae bacterium]|nr:OB-fold nucleic acid binding domain-containing protein [Polyangiaceae bacterium]